MGFDNIDGRSRMYRPLRAKSVAVLHGETAVAQKTCDRQTTKGHTSDCRSQSASNINRVLRTRRINYCPQKIRRYGKSRISAIALNNMRRFVVSSFYYLGGIGTGLCRNEPYNDKKLLFSYRARRAQRALFLSIRQSNLLDRL